MICSTRGSSGGTSLYAGASEAAAQAAVDAAGKADTINIGYVYDSPPTSRTLCYGPGVTSEW
jgi:hypothetical protein